MTKESKQKNQTNTWNMNDDQKETEEETQKSDLDGVSSCLRALWQEVKVRLLWDPEKQEDKQVWDKML